MFVVIGPAVGGIALGLLFFGRDVLDGGHLFWGTLTMLPLLAAMGFVYGIIPATMTGFVASAFSVRIESNHWWLAIATASGVISSGATYIFLSPEMALMMCLAGGIAAFTSGVASLAVRPLGGMIGGTDKITPGTAD